MPTHKKPCRQICPDGMTIGDMLPTCRQHVADMSPIFPAKSKINKMGKVMAVVAVAKYGHSHHHKSSKKAAKEKANPSFTRQCLRCNLLFHGKGKPKHFPYLIRQVPCSWHTSNGVFHTKGRGKLLIKFFENSNSKEFLAELDVFEYD